MKIQLTSYRMFAILLLMLLSLMANGCRSVPDRQWSMLEGPDDPVANSQLLVIEINDKGRFWNPGQFEKMQGWLSEGAEQPVVMFVHGWHHNAEEKDLNLAEFREFLMQIATKTGVRTKGIYVGWRGDSLDPVVFPSLPEPVDFPTIVSRKRVSEIVGQNDLRRIVDQLSSYGDARNVVMIGHSLGGSALYYASREHLQGPVNDHLEIFLINPAVGSREVEPISAGTASTWNGAVGKATSSGDLMQRASATKAVAGASYILARTHRRVTVFQASGDVPVKYLFRFTGNGTAIGFDRNRITHEACADDLANCARDPHKALLRSPLVSDIEISADGCLLRMAKGRFFVKVREQQSATDCFAVYRNPMWVIAGDKTVSTGHNDILNEVQQDALSSLIAFRLRQPLANSASD